MKGRTSFLRVCGTILSSIALDQLTQLVGVAREAEEVVLLLDQLWSGQMLRTEAVDQFIFGVELLAADAVQALVGARVDVAVAVARLPELGDALQVARLDAGADEVVEREVQRLAQGAVVRGVALDQLGGGDALLLGGLRVLEAVLVGSSQKAHILAALAVIARERVGQDQPRRRSRCVGAR